jgi:tryptophan-rich sensory protein
METTFAKSIGSADFLSRAGVVAGVGLVSSLATYQQHQSSWYRDLIKPTFTPTISVIIIISIIIYVLYVWCWFKALQVVSSENRIQGPQPLGTHRFAGWSQVDALFSGGLLLQLLWVLTFFSQRDPSNARFMITLLVAYIACMTWYLWKILKLRDCGILMGVYFVWAVFLTYLNFRIIDNTPKPKIGYDVDRMQLRSRRLKSSSDPSLQD